MQWIGSNRLAKMIKIRLDKNDIRHPTHQICQAGHINQLYHGPLPTPGFSFNYGQCTHTLHGQYIKYQ
jgi:hypothetical protein